MMIIMIMGIIMSRWNLMKLIIRTPIISLVSQLPITITLRAAIPQRGAKGQQKTKGNHQDIKIKEFSKLVNFILIQWLKLFYSFYKKYFVSHQ